MSLQPRRSTSAAVSPGRRAARGAAALLVLALLGIAAACGFNVQTNQPYNPAQGVNYDVGTPPVRVRNLMILSREEGEGFLSATLSTSGRDALTAVAGVPIKPDYTPGAALQVSLRNPVALGNALVILTNRQPLITMSSPDLQIGGEAEVTLTFSTAGVLKARVPVVDADEEPYATISPATSAE